MSGSLRRPDLSRLQNPNLGATRNILFGDIAGQDNRHSGDFATVLSSTVGELDARDLCIEDAPVGGAKLNLIFQPYLEIRQGRYAGHDHATPS